MKKQKSSAIYVRKPELAKELGVSPRTINTWMAANIIPFIRVNPRFVMFSPPRVMAALDSLEIRPNLSRRIQ